MLYAYSNLPHPKYSGSNISMNPLFFIGLFKERLILLADSQFGTFFCGASDTMEAPSVALCTCEMCWELLNAHSKYGRNCCILSCRRLEQHSRHSWCKQSSFCHIYNVQRADWDTLKAALGAFKIKMIILNDFGRAFEWYYFKVILNWWHSPFKIGFHPLGGEISEWEDLCSFTDGVVHTISLKLPLAHLPRQIFFLISQPKKLL